MDEIEKLEMELGRIMGLMTEMHRSINRIGEKGSRGQEIAIIIREKLNTFSHSIKHLNDYIEELRSPKQYNETQKAFRAFIDTIQEVKK